MQKLLYIVICLGSLRINNVNYAQGEAVELTADEAKEPLERGYIEPADESTAKALASESNDEQLEALNAKVLELENKLADVEANSVILSNDERLVLVVNAYHQLSKEQLKKDGYPRAEVSLGLSFEPTPDELKQAVSSVLDDAQKAE